jgi:glycosyltransferase involved in cell wall biosynthesis
MRLMRPLRVCIDARMETGVLGGVEQVVIGLADSFARLTASDEEYLFLVSPGLGEWLEPYMRGPCRTLTAGSPPAGWVRRYRLRHAASRLVPAIGGVPTPPAAPRDLMTSDGTIEQAGVDVIHFPCQMAFLTQVPSIYHPHDLQHLHLPELFPPRDIELRELWYRAFCDQASLVVMMTSWGRDDLLGHYRLDPRKVATVPWGSVLAAYPEPSPADRRRTRAVLDLPERFVFYPAQTWPHKNHERLLEALAVVRERHGEAIPLVCSGHLNDFYDRLRGRVEDLGLEATTRFVGYVDPLQLRSIYSEATALIFPSRFEGWGMPVCEAFSSGVPVASSTATGLPEVTGEAALLFDPDRPEDIADAIWRLWSDAGLRERLIERGRRRAEELSIERGARIFRAHYRRIGGRPLSEEDRVLLAGGAPAPA